eukprot:TRINITY_DN14126_c0_g1_i1.p1 TRINITY_DN14126_c0_g1~~TRINITY_DN14126_c0_g1_i1.p1  ORF type:complete len:102 (+),score=33.97 TRINITY_DN14126_c0_g1_i1:66-371(+)
MCIRDRDYDFILLGCDGIFDQLSNTEVIQNAWVPLTATIDKSNIHKLVGSAASEVLQSTLKKRTSDNVTVVIIAFDNVLSCLLYTSPSPRDQRGARMPSSA